MSIKIMSMIWESGPSRQADRFVLLALADFASDAGECFPSVTTLAKKTCMSIRGVQQILRRLEAEGWLKTNLNAGRNGANSYTITPAPCAPPQDMHPRKSCTPPPHMDDIPPAPRAPEPSLIINEPSEGNSAFEAFNRIAETVHWPKLQKWSPARERIAKARIRDCGGFENWRQAMQRAADSEFLSGRKTGSTPASFDWLNNASNFTKVMEGNYDNRTNHSNGTSGSPRKGGDRIFDEIALAAGLGQAQGSGGF